MIGHLTYAAGAPCPTLVLDARDLPREEPALLMALAETRRWLEGVGGKHVLKIALAEPSRDRLSELDYRFVQLLPDSPRRFDLRGSCGHSLLGAVIAGAQASMLPPLAPGSRARVNVLNNSDRVICEVEDASPGAAYFTVHFRYAPPLPVRKLLLTGEPQTALHVGRERVPVSLVSTGNPYAFVDAASLGVSSVSEMFADRPDLFDRLVRIRMAAASLLGWPPRGAFPKVALTMRDGSGGVAVRAASVPSWHPSLALTGSVCLAAALKIAHTIPWLAARAGGGSGDVVDLHTPGGQWPVSVALATPDGDPRLAGVTVGRRQVTCYGALRIKPPAHLQQKEIAGCRTLSA